MRGRLALALAACLACRGRRAPPRPDVATRVALDVPRPTDAALVTPDAAPVDDEPAPERTRSILAGGGALPSLNQVSLAQDLALAREALPGPARVLFASGPGALAQVRAAPSTSDDLALRLGALLDPRDGRDATHAPAPVRAHRAATAEAVLDAVRATLARSVAPLTLYVAAHGVGGDEPHDAVVNLWEDTSLTVPGLAAVLDGDPLAARPTRVVVTSCFGGGFAELAFHRGDVREGPARTLRCGLFSAPWDRESSGCDPNPDRRAQEGYGLHVLHALRGEDRDGAPLPLAARDFDGDGATGLLDAHTRARIAGRSIDVPTTTSERWLRASDVTPIDREGPPGDALTREEDAVVDALSRALDAPPTLAGARAALDALEAERTPLLARFDALDARDEEARAALAAMVLARWPVLDDPWHPEHARQLDAARREGIAARLDAHPAAAVRAAVAREREALTPRAELLDVRSALARRLLRAHETRALAARVRRQGGEALAVFEALRRCERGR